MCLLIFAGSFPGNLKRVQLTWEAQIINCQATYRTYELVTQLCIVSTAYSFAQQVFFCTTGATFVVITVYASYFTCI